MKILISIDMEGISGLTNWHDKEKRISQFMTNEVNAVIEGIKNYDKKAEILITDSHGYGRNIEILDLPEDVELISGYPRPYYMVTGFKEGFDAAIFVGYHAPAGVESAEMDHTYSSSSIFEIKVNDKIVGEAELNALVLAEENIPVVLIAGDDKLKTFSSHLFNNTKFVITKESLGRFSAKLLHPKKIYSVIKAATIDALKDLRKVKPFRLDKPYEIKITFINSAMAEFASLLPNSNRINGRSISYTHEDFKEIYRFILAAVGLSGRARDL